ncbi:MAG: DUF6465 family protein [Lachnospiraceae bacterium]|nr:DUF6465 family protein [Lachnospiraceae bacterium]
MSETIKKTATTTVAKAEPAKAATTETKKTETKKAEPKKATAAKKTTAKKATTAKKTTAKKATTTKKATPAKKTTTKKAATKATSEIIELQLGDKNIVVSDLVERVKEDFKARGQRGTRKLEVYVNVNEMKAYYVANDRSEDKNGNTLSIDL